MELKPRDADGRRPVRRPHARGDRRDLRAPRRPVPVGRHRQLVRRRRRAAARGRGAHRPADPQEGLRHQRAPDRRRQGARRLGRAAHGRAAAGHVDAPASPPPACATALTPFVEISERAQLERLGDARGCVVAVNNKDIRRRERGEARIERSLELLPAVLRSGAELRGQRGRDRRTREIGGAAARRGLRRAARRHRAARGTSNSKHRGGGRGAAVDACGAGGCGSRAACPRAWCRETRQGTGHGDNGSIVRRSSLIVSGPSRTASRDRVGACRRRALRKRSPEAPERAHPPSAARRCRAGRETIRVTFR